MDRTTIYFVRHAESDVSVRDDLTRPLTARGEADALRVTTALKGLDIARVYSSPYKRAVDTVRDLAQTLGLEIITIDDLRERAVGGWVEDFVGFAKKQWSDFSFKLPVLSCSTTILTAWSLNSSSYRTDLYRKLTPFRELIIDDHDLVSVKVGMTHSV